MKSETAASLLPLAYSYLRVSRPEQASGAGLDRQGDMAAAWCERNGYRLDTQLNLSDAGRSAYKGHHISRGALGRFLALAQQGRLGSQPVLLIEAVDRLSRQEPLDALQKVTFALVEAGVVIIDLEDGRRYDRESLAGDALILLVLKAKAAHDYSKRLGRRLSDHWQRHRENQRTGQKVYRGRGGMHPFWLDLSPDRSAWVPNAMAEGVRAAFELSRTNGLLATATLLNERGYTGPKGKRWTSHGVRRAITDPAARGALVSFRTAAAQSERAHHRWAEARAAAHESGALFTEPEPEIIQTETIEGFYPPLVSAEEWQQAQERMAKRRTAPEVRANRSRGVGANLFEGMVHCIGGGFMGICASRIRSTGELRNYVRCRSSREKKPCSCDGKSWQLIPLQAHVLTRLNAHLLEQALIPGADGVAALQVVKARLAAAQQADAEAAKALANAERILQQAMEAGSFDLAENASAMVEKTRQKRRQAEVALADLRREADLLGARAQPLADLDASGLIQAISADQATQQQRNRLHQALRDAGLQIQLDCRTKAVGMRFGSVADYSWQPLAPLARTRALREGVVNPPLAVDTVDGRALVLGVDGHVIWDSTSPSDPTLLAEHLEGIRAGVKALKPKATDDEIEEIVRQLQQP